MHPYGARRAELIWEEKYDASGKRVAPLRVQDEPDFVAAFSSGNRYIVETKGQEDMNVANKDRTAAIWCENASILTGETWGYLKVKQSEYSKLQAGTFADLRVLGEGVLPLNQA
jgi:hypothetical protein